MVQRRDDIKFDVSTHFKFGENWRNYSANIDRSMIEQAKRGLVELVGEGNIEGKTFLEIGCGSGIHSLSALELGAEKVLASDIDPGSVETTRSVIANFWEGSNYEVSVKNILNDFEGTQENYDIVYSWGVLHHTGAMWEAVGKASRLVKPGGLFVIAIYKHTAFCPIWRLEKRIYNSAPNMISGGITLSYSAVILGLLLASGRNPYRYISEYRSRRGMLWLTDIKDWLGGYPYESARGPEIVALMDKKGFGLEAEYNTAPPKLWGLLGSGCAEYRFRKNPK